DIVNKHKASYRFKIDNKRFSENVKVFREILNICPRIPGQEFDEPPTEEEALSFIRELGHFGEIKYITDVIVDHLHQPWRTFASIINKCLCGKKTTFNADRDKGLNVLSEVALYEVAQVKEALKKSKKDSHMLHASGSGDGVGSQPKVFDESEDKTTDSGDDERNDDDDSDEVTKDDDEDDVESGVNKDKEASDSERTDSDDDENFNVIRMMMKKKNIKKKLKKERKGDAEMIDDDKNVSQERSYEPVVDDAHVTLTTTQKTEGSMQSSFVSSDFASKFLNLNNVPPTNNEVASLMNVKVCQEESSTIAPHLLTVLVTTILETSTVAATTVLLIIQPFSYIQQMTTPTSAP
nr:hypothetical protein [Tanacetum cinerariifolium]